MLESSSMAVRSSRMKRLFAAVFVASLLAVPTIGAAHSEVWVARENGAGNFEDEPYSVEVSPDGGRVFVAGFTTTKQAHWSSDFTVVAYDATSGSQIWSSIYNGPDNYYDSAADLKVSPDGTRVYVTGGSTSYNVPANFVTIAYAADTGQQLWIAFYDSSAGLDDNVVSMTLSADGTRIYLTGFSHGRSDDYYDVDYTTVAYDASTGARLWAAQYRSPHSERSPRDAAYSIAASPDGTRVFITGESGDVGATTIAYDASSGAELWVVRDPGPAHIWASSFSVSADNSRAYITGWTASSDKTSDLNYFTAAYDSVTGSKIWWSEYGEPEIEDAAYKLTRSADGSHIYVTGRSARDYATLAYDPATGEQLWAARYSASPQPEGWDTPTDLAVTNDGRLLVTGTVDVFNTQYGLWQDYYGTVAYDARTGQQIWATYSGLGNDEARSIAVNPAGTRAFVTGTNVESYKTRRDWSTVSIELDDGLDVTPPSSSFDRTKAIFAATPLTPDARISGETTDDHSGVAEVTVVFEPLMPPETTLTQTASLSCSAVNRRSCTWSTPLPTSPGLYRVRVTARDRDNNLESPGPAPIEILIL